MANICASPPLWISPKDDERLNLAAGPRKVKEKKPEKKPVKKPQVDGGKENPKNEKSGDGKEKGKH